MNSAILFEIFVNHDRVITCKLLCDVEQRGDLRENKRTSSISKGNPYHRLLARRRLINGLSPDRNNREDTETKILTSLYIEVWKMNKCSNQDNCALISKNNSY